MNQSPNVDCDKARRLLDSFQGVPVDIVTRQMLEEEWHDLLTSVAIALNSTPREVRELDGIAYLERVCMVVLEAEHLCPDAYEPVCGSLALLCLGVSAGPAANVVTSLKHHANHHVRLVTLVDDQSRSRDISYATDGWLHSLVERIDDDLVYYKPSRRDSVPNCVFAAVSVAIQRMLASDRLGRLGALPIAKLTSLGEREVLRGTAPSSVRKGAWL